MTPHCCHFNKLKKATQVKAGRYDGIAPFMLELPARSGGQLHKTTQTERVFELEECKNAISQINKSLCFFANVAEEVVEFPFSL